MVELTRNGGNFGDIGLKWSSDFDTQFDVPATDSIAAGTIKSAPPKRGAL